MTHEEARETLERLFMRGLPPGEEKAFRLHLEDCARCRARYDRYALLAPIDRKMLSTVERLAPGLGFARRRPRPAVRLWGTISLAVACAALALFLLPARGRDTGPSTFASRGAGRAGPAGAAGAAGREASFGLWIFQNGARAPGSAPALLSRQMKPDDELAFAYVNPTAKPYLAIFATDERNNVYWYHPAWRPGEAPPQSIPTVRGTKIEELKESIRHPIVGRHLVISAVLSDHPVGVQAIEMALARGASLTSVDPTAVVVAKREVEIIP